MDIPAIPFNDTASGTKAKYGTVLTDSVWSGLARYYYDVLKGTSNPTAQTCHALWSSMGAMLSCGLLEDIVITGDEREWIEGIKHYCKDNKKFGGLAVSLNDNPPVGWSKVDNGVPLETVFEYSKHIQHIYEEFILSAPNSENGESTPIVADRTCHTDGYEYLGGMHILQDYQKASQDVARLYHDDNGKTRKLSPDYSEDKIDLYENSWDYLSSAYEFMLKGEPSRKDIVYGLWFAQIATILTAIDKDHIVSDEHSLREGIKLQLLNDTFFHRTMTELDILGDSFHDILDAGTLDCTDEWAEEFRSQLLKIRNSTFREEVKMYCNL